jgi:hypothetical protein
MSDVLLRIYPPEAVGPDGYPMEWHFTSFTDDGERLPAVKHYVRELAGHRCERCGHPYPPGIAETCPRGEWTPCDEQCGPHGGPYRWIVDGEYVLQDDGSFGPTHREAQWRILTVHHLNGVKWDCRWWNLAALCQRCHLTIQGKVLMERVYPLEHSEWFKPHAAGWYAAAYLGEELSREETMERLEELLALERQDVAT